jgi:DNA end-binding protein Ku
MARAMWKGSISFGLVTIPVSLNVAVKGKDIHFHQVHDTDLGRIREKRVCELDGKEVPYEHVVKGFEVSKNKIITLTREELKAADPEKDKLVTIQLFVPSAEVDPLYFERSYFLSPDGKAASKAYGLFRAALEKTEQVAIARIVLSTQEHLCLIRAHDGVLLLTTMAFSDEVEEAPEVGHAAPTDKELKMAEALIEQMAGKFEPEKFHDEHRKRVLALIKSKAEGKELKTIEARPTEKITDLAEALERSLAAQKGGKAAPHRARARGHRAPAKHAKHAS